MEAGNRCKDECLPEETNRRIVDVISDVNMCYSEFARKYLADTGLPKERTYQTGSPMAEVLHMNLEKIQKSDVLERLGLEKDKYILLSAHREENIDSEKNFLSLFTAINALAEKYDMPILYSCHPRSKHRLEKSGFKLDPRVRVNEPLGFNDYNKLQMNALAIVSDSGTLPEESSFYLSIGHPIAAVCIRTSTERPEALEAGDFILAGITTRELLNATDMAMQEQGLMSSLPLANNLVPIKRALTTTSTAIFVPFTTQELFMEGDSLYYGLNAVSNNMIMADRKQLKNPNGLILGTPGSGKSFSAKREMTNVFFTTTDDIIIADPEGEYYPLVEALGGQVIHISSTSRDYINPILLPVSL